MAKLQSVLQIYVGLYKVFTSSLDLRFFTAVTIKNTVFWDEIPCNLVNVRRYFSASTFSVEDMLSDE
jgi:hypothetical protein